MIKRRVHFIHAFLLSFLFLLSCVLAFFLSFFLSFRRLFVSSLLTFDARFRMQRPGAPFWDSDAGFLGYFLKKIWGRIGWDRYFIKKTNRSQKCILFFCGPFFDFLIKKHLPEVSTLFLWSIFALLGRKHLPEVYTFFCGPFLHFLSQNPSPRSVYYFFVVHFCTFWRKNHLPEV